MQNLLKHYHTKIVKKVILLGNKIHLTSTSPEQCSGSRVLYRRIAAHMLLHESRKGPETFDVVTMSSDRLPPILHDYRLTIVRKFIKVHVCNEKSKKLTQAR